MIVNPLDDGWEIIYHRAHALLAAQIAGHWRQTEQPLRVIDTIAAIAQHDDLEREWEGNHLSAAGAPLDFTLGEEHLEFLEPWRRLIADANYRGRWVALLTAMHVSFLNAPHRGRSKKLDAFLDELAAQEEQWRSALGIAPEEAQRAYAFVQWCDRLSLILCQRELPARERWLEISAGPDGRRYDVRQRDDGTVEVDPWPFAAPRLSVDVDACYVAQLRFKDAAELTEALKTAVVRTLHWEFAAAAS